MVSYALDDRQGLDGPGLDRYDIAFVRDAWRYFGPVETLTLGRGDTANVPSSRGGGNYYVLLKGGADGAAIAITTTSSAETPDLAWKLVRYR